ncbi:sugar transferase [uncultured Ruminococcus sp.]|uniref:sugar transferase n=1 Tax=uncultured Ruminococcus sp. TaxID=165186 RepID=UPI0026378484|nr:sugar transferase [uncultured Ruminococcus sp.]
MENLGYLLQDEDMPQTVKRRAESTRPGSLQLENVSKKYLFTKRLMDVVASSFAIVILAIPMLLISLVIFLQDFHSPLFKQVRVTKDGRFFTMYKFRTMCVDAEQKLEELRQQNEADGPVFKMKKDPRVTPIGRFLRKTSLDELPQFFNVLNGTMSLVGPRPPLPREVEQYTPYQMHRLDAKGGITCYWQCSGRSNIMFDEWVELDLKYIRDRSVSTDIKILGKTVVAVLRRDGAA